VKSMTNSLAIVGAARRERSQTIEPGDVRDVANGDVAYFNIGPLDEPATNHGLRGAVLTVTAAGVIVLSLIALLAAACARDGGQFAGAPLKEWFDRLASGKGLCCSFADGVSIADVDWGTQDGHYRVRIDGQWIDVPDAALVGEPNRFGRAVVWPYRDEATGATQIRCFLPGAGA
jgi:hypothetical protein